MKFYKLSNSIDHTITGNYPQGQKSIVPGNIEQLYGVTVPDNEGLILPELLLENKTIITDFIQVVTVSPAFFLIINDKLRSILSAFSIGRVNSFAIKMHHLKKIIDSHYIFYLLESKEDLCVDYSKSSFFIGKLKDYKYVGETITIDNSIDYRIIKEKLLSKNLYLKSKELHFNFSNIKDDLIRIMNVPFGSGYYISERLKEAIESNNLTGMSFKECNVYNSKIKAVF
ncbi:hypothetical protein ACFO3O_22015 [Dokdonia ponticola]|uniref:Uncharacterized protein n=1 Tax=Dokdonia ponticola TaxID=2041041 RepID=A0ABV9I2G6_9FLAO